MLINVNREMQASSRKAKLCERTTVLRCGAPYWQVSSVKQGKPVGCLATASRPSSALCRIQQVQLLNLAVGRIGGIELRGHKRTVGRAVGVSVASVLPHSSEAVGRDSIGGFYRCELGCAGAPERLAGKVCRRAAVHRNGGGLPCRARSRRRVGVERDAHARRLAEHIGDIDVFERVQCHLPLLLEAEMREIVFHRVVLHLQRGQLLNEVA